MPPGRSASMACCASRNTCSARCNPSTKIRSKNPFMSLLVLATLSRSEAKNASLVILCVPPTNGSTHTAPSGNIALACALSCACRDVRPTRPHLPSWVPGEQTPRIPHTRQCLPAMHARRARWAQMFLLRALEWAAMCAVRAAPLETPRMNARQKLRVLTRRCKPARHAASGSSRAAATPADLPPQIRCGGACSR